MRFDLSLKRHTASPLPNSASPRLLFDRIYWMEFPASDGENVFFITCAGGGTGRHGGLKPRRPSRSLRVRIPPGAARVGRGTGRLA